MENKKVRVESLKLQTPGGRIGKGIKDAKSLDSMKTTVHNP